MDGFTCFDCEMYADEADLPDTYEIREDQRSKQATDWYYC